MSLCDTCERQLASLFTLCWRSISDERSDFVQNTELIKSCSSGSGCMWTVDKHKDKQSSRIRNHEGVSQEICITPFDASAIVEDFLQNRETCWFCSKLCLMLDADRLSRLYDLPETGIKDDSHAQAFDIRASLDASFEIWTSDGHTFLHLDIRELPGHELDFEHVGYPSGPPGYIHLREEILLNMSSANVRKIEYTTSATEIAPGLEVIDKLELKPASDPEVGSASDRGHVPAFGSAVEERIKIAQSWFCECNENHSACLSLLEAKQVRPSDLPKRLLRVFQDGSSLQLVETQNMVGLNVRYMTLSHCWGSENFLNLTRENYKDFERGKPVAELAATFQHVTLLARLLGFEYLWIDCLCIVQDSLGDVDWSYEATRMHIVYGNSALTIAATGSACAADGIFHPLDLGLSTQVVVGLPNGLLMRPSGFGAQELSQREFERSPLLKRGWVQQEMAMSRRVLHWTRGQLVWQCTASVQTETMGPLNFHKDIWAGIYADANLWLSQYIVSPVYIARRWAAIARSYAPTAVTRPRDRYYAISGLAIQTQRAFDRAGIETEYMAGVWKHDIIRCIAWHRDFSYPEKDDAGPSSLSLYRSTFVPSWSWLRVTNRIYFPGLSAYIPNSLRQGDRSSDENVDWWTPYVELVDSSIVYEDNGQTLGPLLSATLTIKALMFEDLKGLDSDFENMEKLLGAITDSSTREVFGFSSRPMLCPHDKFRWFCRWQFDAEDGVVPRTRALLKYALLGKEVQRRDMWHIYALILQRIENSRVKYKRIGMLRTTFLDAPWWKADSRKQVVERYLQPSVRPQKCVEKEIILV